MSLWCFRVLRSILTLLKCQFLRNGIDGVFTSQAEFYYLQNCVVSVGEKKKIQENEILLNVTEEGENGLEKFGVCMDNRFVCWLVFFPSCWMFTECLPNTCVFLLISDWVTCSFFVEWESVRIYSGCLQKHISRSKLKVGWEVWLKVQDERNFHTFSFALCSHCNCTQL